MARTILIIDDERDMQIYLRTLFRKAGYEAVVAPNGEEGVIRAGELQPDLITLDLLMPRKSGVLAYEALRADPATAGIPIVILTGLSEHREVLGAVSPDLPGPDAVVEKPIKREEFLRTLERILGG